MYFIVEFNIVWYAAAPSNYIPVYGNNLGNSGNLAGGGRSQGHPPLCMKPCSISDPEQQVHSKSMYIDYVMVHGVTA